MAERVERLTNLLALLLETSRPLTFAEIGAELAGQYPPGASAARGAFERDKAVLRELGVPIEQTVLGGDQAGQTAYRVDRARYELRGLELTADETQALQVAVAAVRSGSSWGDEALWKLGAAAPPEFGGAVVAHVPSLAQLPALREAIARHSAAEFVYRGDLRTIDPYGLLLREGFWYVVGRDHRHDELRTFRVDRIESAVELGPPQAFDRPAGFDPASAFPADPKALGGGPPVTAVVRFDARAAARVERDVGSDRVVARLDDGSIDVSVEYVNPDAFRSWVLGHRSAATVLSPPEARQLVVDWLKAIVGG
jgi:predicted DNA-binding transcriptional regulator YafY